MDKNSLKKAVAKVTLGAMFLGSILLPAKLSAAQSPIRDESRIVEVEETPMGIEYLIRFDATGEVDGGYDWLYKEKAGDNDTKTHAMHITTESTHYGSIHNQVSVFLEDIEDITNVLDTLPQSNRFVYAGYGLEHWEEAPGINVIKSRFEMDGIPYSDWHAHDGTAFKTNDIVVLVDIESFSEVNDVLRGLGNAVRFRAYSSDPDIRNKEMDVSRVGFYLRVLSPTAIEEVPREVTPKLGDIVTSGTARINYNFENDGRIEIYSMDGSRVENKEVSGEGIASFENLSAGAYIVRQLEDGKEPQSRKLIVAE